MKQHIVKCAVCGKDFDLSTIQGVKYNSRRYAHIECFPNGEIVPLAKNDLIKVPAETVEDKEKQEYKDLKDYITNLFAPRKVNWGIVGKQLKSYRENFNYQYKSMLKTLRYAYEIKKENIEMAEGVGIIPIYYQDAYNYYYSIWLAQQKNEVIIPKVEDEVITIAPPQRKNKKKNLFSFLDEEKV